MAWEWIGIGAPLTAAAGAWINELSRRSKNDDEQLELARKGLKAAKEDLGGDPVMVAAYEREVERALVRGVRVQRRFREFVGQSVLGFFFLCVGVVIAQFGSRPLVDGNLSPLEFWTAIVWVVVGGMFGAIGIGVVLHAQATTSAPRRGFHREEVERDLRADGRLPPQPPTAPPTDEEGAGDGAA